MARGNFKVRAIKTYDDFTIKGKIYEFIDGQTKWECWKSCIYKDFEDFMSRNETHFYGVLEEVKVGDEKMNNGNFKIKALVTISGYFTKDKIYEFTDGKTTWDSGVKSSCYDNFKQFLRQNAGWKTLGVIEEVLEEEIKFTKEELEAISVLLSLGIDRLKEIVGMSNGILTKMKLMEEQYE